MEKKTIVITGAGSGFGKEAAKLFTQDGHNLILLDINEETLKGLALENAFYKKTDVTNAKQFKDAVNEGVEKFGPVDLLLNCAGVMKLGPMGSQNPSEYKDMIDINIHGVINGVESVINSMKERQTGTIINFASTAGLRPYPNHAVYGATKYAVVGLSENLRREAAPHKVRVTAISPGAFSTNLLSGTTDKDLVSGYEDWKGGMSVMAKPIEVAKMIKYIFDAPQELNVESVSLHSTEQVE